MGIVQLLHFLLQPYLKEKNMDPSFGGLVGFFDKVYKIWRGTENERYSAEVITQVQTVLNMSLFVC